MSAPPRDWFELPKQYAYLEQPGSASRPNPHNRAGAAGGWRPASLLLATPPWPVGCGFASAVRLSRYEKIKTMHFQDINHQLEPVLAEQGCLLRLRPMTPKKGRRTMSPHTLLRAIGPGTLGGWPIRALRRLGYHRRPLRRQFPTGPKPLTSRPGVDHHHRLWHPGHLIWPRSKPSAIRAAGDQTSLCGKTTGNRPPAPGACGWGGVARLHGGHPSFTYFQQCGGLDCRPVGRSRSYGSAPSPVSPGTGVSAE